MSQEYYHSDEFNQFGEYEQFPAELYRGPDEIDKSVPETLTVKEENTAPEPTARKEDKGLMKKLMDKLTKANSQVISGVTTGVATAVAGVAAAATVFTPIIAPAPDFSVDELYAGEDYAYYSVYAEGLDESVDYTVEISNSKQQFQFPLDEGVNENTVSGLIPGLEYTVSLYGKSEEKIRMEYVRKKFYTLGDGLPSVSLDMQEIPQENGRYSIRYSTDISDRYDKFTSYRLQIRLNGVLQEEKELPEGRFEGQLTEPENGLYSLSVSGVHEGRLIPLSTRDFDFQSQPPPILYPQQFGAEFLKPSADQIEITYDENRNYQLFFRTNFQNSTDHEFCYRIVLIGDMGEELNVYRGTDPSVVLTLDKSLSTVSVRYEELGIFDGKEKVYGTYELPEKVLLAPSHYGGSFLPVSCRDMNVLWNQNGFHQITIPLQFVNQTNEPFSYRITVYNDAGFRKVWEGTDASAVIPIPADIPEVRFRYEEIGMFHGVAKVYNHFEADGTLILEAPTVTMSPQFGYDEYGNILIPYILNSRNAANETYLQLNFRILFSDGTETRGESWDLAAGEENNLILSELPPGNTSFTVIPVLIMQTGSSEQERIEELAPITYQLSEKLELLSANVSVTDRMATLTFAFYGSADSKALVKNSASGAIYEVAYNQASFNLDNAPMDLVYYVADLQGNPISPETPIRIRTDVTANYTFNYKNPSDVLKTYHPDGSYNLYFDLDFACDDPDVFYQIILTKNFGSTVFEFRDKIAVIENLKGSYGIVYRVCKVIDGVTYIFKDVPVSGTTEEDPADLIQIAKVQPGNTGDILHLELSSNVRYRLDGAKLICDGKEIRLNPGQFIRNDYGSLTAEIPIDSNVKTLYFEFELIGNQGLLNLLKDKVQITGSIFRKVLVDLNKLPY